MTPEATCPTCGLPVTPAGQSHRTSDGAVSYARCACGRWVVLLAGTPIAATGSSDLNVQLERRECATRAA
jgi:hypothetical protein